MALFRRLPLPFTESIYVPNDPGTPPFRGLKLAAVVAMSAGLFAPPFPTPNVPTVDKYLIAFSEPVRLDLRKNLHAKYHPSEFQVLLGGGEAIFEDKWHQGWSIPVRYARDPKAALALSASGLFWTSLDFAAGPGANYESPWHYPWSEPKRFKPGLAAAAQPFSGFLHPNPTVPISYYNWLSEPKRFKRDPKAAIALIASGPYWTSLDYAAGPGASFESPWHYPWSEPKRFKKALSTALHPFEFNPASFAPPVINYGYYRPFSEPKRFKPGLLAGLQRPLFEDPANTTLPGSRPTWFAPFSEPKRFKPALGVEHHQYSLIGFPIQPQVNTLIQWYANLSQPVMLPIGLKTWLQMTTAMPSRLLPTPDITATMAATETNADRAQIVYILSSGIVSYARVSVTEGPRDGAALSISES